jgi:hypothetical protein
MINAVKPKSTNYPVPIVGEVVYPDEFMDELEAEAEIASLQAKTGELPYYILRGFCARTRSRF